MLQDHEIQPKGGELHFHDSFQGVQLLQRIWLILHVYIKVWQQVEGLILQHQVKQNPSKSLLSGPSSTRWSSCLTPPPGLLRFHPVCSDNSSDIVAK